MIDINSMAVECFKLTAHLFLWPVFEPDFEWGWSYHAEAHENFQPSKSGGGLCCLRRGLQS
jgi:hypothetical protein